MFRKCHFSNLIPLELHVYIYVIFGVFQFRFYEQTEMFIVVIGQGFFMSSKDKLSFQKLITF